ncbi:hypothetical protein GCM10027162_15880 [Streptomyces incanus]
MEVLGIDETRRGRPRWEQAPATGKWRLVRDRWHTCFVDALGTGGLLRAAGRPAPEDPDGSDDEELSGRASIAERLQDEVAWVRQCAEWIDHLDSRPYPPAANLRPEGDFPDTCAVPIRLPGSRRSCGASPSTSRNWLVPGVWRSCRRPRSPTTRAPNGAAGWPSRG